jgi:hypothetical protein
MALSNWRWKLLTVCCTSSRLVASAASSDWATLCTVSPTLRTTCSRVLRLVRMEMARPTSSSTSATSTMAASVMLACDRAVVC